MSHGSSDDLSRLPDDPSPASVALPGAADVGLTGKVVAGRGTSLVFLLAVGAAVALALGMTVHNRSTEEIIRKAPPRYEQLITFWIRRGYFRHGGLWIRRRGLRQAFAPPAPKEPVQWAYRTSSMSYLQLGHLLERIHYGVTGRYSHQLMAISSQALVWLSSALLGLLAMRLALRMGAPGLHALLLGAGCQIVHATFGVNLNYYWEVYYTTVAPIFLILFLLLSETLLDGGRISRGAGFCRALCVFVLFHLDPSPAFLFILTYLLCCAVLCRGALSGRRILAQVVLPAAAGMLLFGAQLLCVKLAFPGVKFVGSSLLFRTGFDGSTGFYRDHWNLLFSKYRDVWDFLNWPCLLWAGVGATALLVALYHRIPQLRIPVFMVLATLGMWVPFAFLFSQGTTIHPYAYDSYLVIPMILASLAILPATIERFTRNTGIFVLVFFVAACCYCMVQIRAYAVVHPLT